MEHHMDHTKPRIHLRRYMRSHLNSMQVANFIDYCMAPKKKKNLFNPKSFFFFLISITVRLGYRTLCSTLQVYIIACLRLSVLCSSNKEYRYVLHRRVGRRDMPEIEWVGVVGVNRAKISRRWARVLVPRGMDIEFGRWWLWWLWLWAVG
jgi:hypothetical protein